MNNNKSNFRVFFINFEVFGLTKQVMTDAIERELSITDCLNEIQHMLNEEAMYWSLNQNTRTAEHISEFDVTLNTLKMFVYEK
jgi:hypothetical protein